VRGPQVKRRKRGKRREGVTFLAMHVDSVTSDVDSFGDDLTVTTKEVVDGVLLSTTKEARMAESKGSLLLVLDIKRHDATESGESVKEDVKLDRTSVVRERAKDREVVVYGRYHVDAVQATLFELASEVDVDLISITIMYEDVIHVSAGGAKGRPCVFFSVEWRAVRQGGKRITYKLSSSIVHVLGHEHGVCVVNLDEGLTIPFREVSLGSERGD